MSQFNPNMISTEQVIEAQRSFLTKVYSWMFLGLLITAVVAWYTLSNNELLLFIFENSLMLPLFIGEIALVWILSANIEKFSKSTAMLMFLAYSSLNGITLSPIFLVYTGESIMNVFSIAAVSFGGLSLYGYYTKRDLSGMRSFLVMGLIGVVVSSVLNIFMNSSMLSFIISYAGVIVFAGLTAYDTQKLKEMSIIELEGGETAGKMAIMGALRLYLDFINLFLFLLRILGSRR
jgi:FtsH-binding integral membrane protein